MLQVKELMIGDWVKPYGSKDGIYAKVTSIEPNRVGLITINGQPHHGTEDTLCPISLTSEILKKNGWHTCEDYYIYSGDEIYIAIKLHSDGTIELTLESITTWELHINLQYVHQLQHALRLCGIEKEIEL